MNKPLITFENLTFALKAKDILSKNNIRSYIKRVYKTDKQTNCGYGLYIPYGSEKAKKILNATDVNIGKTIKGGDNLDIP